jgi:ornithine cyclodeaminase/alanine dehydrogenase-like protein (mu-crystallin family)
MSAPPLRYLSAADVRAAMPPVEERLELARRTMIALVADAELPPKLGVHPRQTASFTSAMPALLRGSASSGQEDLLGIKWVTAFPGNRGLGVPAINATVILNDAVTGLPLAILDGGPITAERTAAVSGVALREWWPDATRAAGVVLVGAGIQGISHVDVLAHIAPDSALTIVDRHADRAQELAERARSTGRFAAVVATTDVEAAVAGADVVMTMVSFGPRRQTVAPGAFDHAQLIVAVDYDMCVPAGVVARASRFLVDDVAQFEATRTETVFRDYPRPDASIGQALTSAAPAPRGAGPVVVNHLGVGLADVVFADAIARRAAEMGLGTELAR